MSRRARAADPDALRWEFNAADRQAQCRAYWRARNELVLGGRWAELLEERGAIVTSLLPVLCLHTFPGAKGSGVGDQWTGWCRVSAHRLAKLAGLSINSIGAAFRHLADEELLEERRVSPLRLGGRPRREFRLSSQLYGTNDDRYRMWPANVAYSGLWCVLPPAARHLWIVLGALDPIADEEKWVASGGDLESARFQSSRSMGELAELSGLSPRTVAWALSILTHPIFDPANLTPPQDEEPLALVNTGEGKDGFAWYAIEPRALTWFFTPSYIATAQGIQKLRHGKWPQLFAPTRKVRRAPTRQVLR